MIDELIEIAEQNDLYIKKELETRFFESQLFASWYYDSTQSMYEARKNTEKYLHNMIAMHNEGNYQR